MGGARPDSPFEAQRHQTKEAGASSPGAARTHRPRPGPRWPGRQRLSRNGGRRKGGGGAAGRAGRPPCPRRPAIPGAPRPASPKLPSPATANHAPVRRETPPGLFVAASWCCPRRAGRGRGGGSRGWAAWAAGAGARASGLRPLVQGRARARPHRHAALRTASLQPRSSQGGGGGRAPFSCSAPARPHARPAPSFPASACAPRAPALLGRAHPPRLRPARLPPPPPSGRGDLRACGLNKPLTPPGPQERLVVWRHGQSRGWTWARRKGTWTGWV